MFECSMLGVQHPYVADIIATPHSVCASVVRAIDFNSVFACELLAARGVVPELRCKGSQDFVRLAAHHDNSNGVRRPHATRQASLDERRYQSIPEMTRAEIAAAIERGDPGELRYAVLAAALYDPDPDWAEDLCLRLAAHPHFNVRGNALLGLGHIARLHRRLDRARSQPALDAGLQDADPYVRGQADAATGDVEHFLGWRFRHDPVRDWHDGLPIAGARFLRNDRVETATGQRGVVFGLLRLEPEAEYLVDFAPDDPDTDVPPAAVVDSALRPVA